MGKKVKIRPNVCFQFKFYQVQGIFKKKKRKEKKKTKTQTKQTPCKSISQLFHLLGEEAIPIGKLFV